MATQMHDACVRAFSGATCSAGLRWECTCTRTTCDAGREWIALRREATGGADQYGRKGGATARSGDAQLDAGVRTSAPKERASGERRVGDGRGASAWRSRARRAGRRGHAVRAQERRAGAFRRARRQQRRVRAVIPARPSYRTWQTRVGIVIAGALWDEAAQGRHGGKTRGKGHEPEDARARGMPHEGMSTCRGTAARGHKRGRGASGRDPVLRDTDEWTRGKDARYMCKRCGTCAANGVQCELLFGDGRRRLNEVGCRAGGGEDSDRA
ncbi:hypothetical protein HYPSUDRAFT_53525 [Hypholoma sublateritium FD-334 SS-4]|uniref:Uncharacterized protein n=1 Tax=Hypholoma sublateritium (strain FD-334 SS-4) TaxID=945553 RepID=A0A0D2P1G1_HYPSF|nr:hypothetical protein HYPSUDRAFT_53525 [Hypholoma sublateritium FD-334 SS-4]